MHARVPIATDPQLSVPPYLGDACGSFPPLHTSCRQYRWKSPAERVLSSDPAPQASAQDGTRAWEVGIVMPGAQLGSSEGQRTGIVREGEGLCVCSWYTGAEQGHLVS